MTMATAVFSKPVMTDDGFGGFEITGGDSIIRMGKLEERTARMVTAEGRMVVKTTATFSCSRAEIGEEWACKISGRMFKILAIVKGENYGRSMTVTMEVQT